MQGNASLTFKQEKFLALLLQGSTIVDAAKQCEVNESTAHRWLKNPLFRAEQKRLQSSFRDAEQAAIEQVVTITYASIEQRVQALDRLAKKLESYLEDEDKVWLPDVKSVGTGPTAERVDLVQFNAALFHEYRATFDDLAKELGQRIRKQEVEHSGLVEVLNAEHASLLGDLEALPDAGEVKTEDRTTTADSH